MKIEEVRRPWQLKEGHRHNHRNDRGFNYQGKAWRDTSAAFLRANPKCVECGQPSKISDHKQRVKDGGDPYNWNNLQPMCQKCHNKKDNNAGKK